MKNIKIIAEIGWNHMGDMNLAQEMIRSAAINGADYCKFQTWSEKNLKKGPWDTDGRREIYKKAELSEKDHLYLIDTCKKYKINFLTSVFDTKSLQMVCDLGVSEIKIPSHEIYNSDLIQLACKNFDKIFISAGAATWDEIINLKNFIDNNKAVIMHCVSAYPTVPEDINMPKLIKLKENFNQIGYSGHYQGIDDALAAMCLGSIVIEKHFTIDNELPGRDNKFAILPSDLNKISKFRDNYENMMIDKGLDLQKNENDIYTNYRGRWNNHE